VVRKAYTKRVYVDKAFLRNTSELVQQHIDAKYVHSVNEFLEINEATVKYIAQSQGGERTKVINLIKSIERTAEEESEDPFLIALSERAKAVQESFENRQVSTQEALQELLDAIEKDEQRKKEQAAKGFDSLTYFVYRALEEAGVPDAETASQKIRQAFDAHPNWRGNGAALREVRQQVTFAICAEVDDLDQVTALVDELFNLLLKAYREE